MEASSVEFGKNAMELDMFRGVLNKFKEELTKGSRDKTEKLRKGKLGLDKTRKKISKASKKLERANGKVKKHSIKLSDTGDKHTQTLVEKCAQTLWTSTLQRTRADKCAQETLLNQYCAQSLEDK